MMNRKIMLMAAISALLFISGCALFEDDSQDITDMQDLTINDDFNYETERWVDVKLYSLYDGTFYLRDMDDNILFKGNIDNQTGFEQKIKLRSAIEDIKIEFLEVDVQVKNYRIRDNLIEYSFIPQLR